MKKWKNDLKRDKYNELAPDVIIESFEDKIKEAQSSRDSEMLSNLIDNLKKINGRIPQHIKEFLDEDLISESKTNRNTKLGFLGAHFDVDDDEYLDMLKTLIREEDIDADGYEEHPHITIVFGFDPSVKKKDIKSDMEDKCLFHRDIEFKGLEVFEKDDYDVIVVKVESKKLRKFNEFFNDKYPVESLHPDYKPHMTIAYVKKGLGKVYVSGHSGKDIISKVIDYVKNKTIYYRFRDANRNETLFTIVCD